MKKTILVILMLLLSLSLCTSGVWGDETLFPDQTLARRFSGAFGPSNIWLDAIEPNPATGISFQTYGATFNFDTCTLTIYTDWSEGNSLTIPLVTYRTAYLFLDTTPVVFPNEPSYDVAINLDSFYGPYVAIYDPVITDSVEVSDGNTGASYGGTYTTLPNFQHPDGNDPPQFPVPVLAAADGGSTEPVSVVWGTGNVPFPDDPDFGNLVNTVAIDLSGIDGIDCSRFDYLWGTATCANDVIYQPVPIPGAVLLLGAGLLRLTGYMRKRTS